jgi:mono/diheme cytochrome c family protein
MMRALKWSGAIIVTLAFVALCVFLYVMPPFLITPPEAFSQTMRDAAPPVTAIADPKVRAIAGRGRYIVMTTGCIGCHATNGNRGPDYSKYLAGGALKMMTPNGTFVTRNLTPDEETGLGKRSDEEVKRVLRSGVLPDGHIAPHTAMPWANFSHWSEEDRYAVVVYLRNLPPVRHEIPEPTLTPPVLEPGVIERGYGMKDYGRPND